MPDHALQDNPHAPKRGAVEPVGVAEAVRMILAVIVGAGWLTLDTQAVNWIITAVGLVASVVMSWQARSKVTPLAAPRNRHGAALAPIPQRRPPEA